MLASQIPNKESDRVSLAHSSDQKNVIKCFDFFMLGFTQILEFSKTRAYAFLRFVATYSQT